jgi:hypothetical protein
MKDAGLIESEVFSFYFEHNDFDTTASYVDFGQYQETSIEGEIKYIPVFDDFFWSFETKAVAFGESPEDKAKKFSEPIYTILDTSSATIALDYNYFDKFIEEVFSKASGSDYQLE